MSSRLRIVFLSVVILVLDASNCWCASCINASHLVNTFVLTSCFDTVNLRDVPNYSQIIQEFQDELQRLMLERNKIDDQIQRLSKALESVQILAADSDAPVMEPPPLPPDEEAGFTNRVRAVLNANTSRYLTAIEVRDVLTGPRDDPKTMLIHTHNTLKRLHRQGEIDEQKLSDGKAGYKAKSIWEHVLKQWVDASAKASTDATSLAGSFGSKIGKKK
jgi:hypothetical protein